MLLHTEIVMTDINLQDLLDAEIQKHSGKRGRHSYRVTTEETKDLIRQKRKLQGPTFLGHTHSEESRAKISEGNKGKVGWSRGKKLTTEHKAKLSQAHTGKKRPAEVVEKCRLSNIGHEVTQATRDKIRATHLARAPSVMTPHGVFPSTGAVAAAANVSKTTVRNWIKKYPQHYYYVS